MSELNAGAGAALVNEVDDARPCASLLVVPQPGVLRTDPPARCDGGGLGDHRTEP
ncbi:MAG TPA: hypothetical protein VFN32_07760 [Rhodococcus sp. (in: high G+C Gram-positive bacteria)]|nr:hypothetical protein [Rhodococcus sp. (in: high G+C Gram-positive bacteria)]